MKYKGIEHNTNGTDHLVSYFQYQLPEPSILLPA